MVIICNQDLTSKVFFHYHFQDIIQWKCSIALHRPDTIELLNNFVRLQNQKHKYWLHLMLQWVSHVIACLEWWVLRKKFFHCMPLALCCKGCLISIATLSWSRRMWKVGMKEKMVGGCAFLAAVCSGVLKWGKVYIYILYIIYKFL